MGKRKKIWYFVHQNAYEYVIAYGDTPENAFETFVWSREDLEVDPDMSHYSYIEFTPDTFDGVLYIN